MTTCDHAAVIAAYLEVMDNKPRDGAALYCEACAARVIYSNGEWRTND